MRPKFNEAFAEFALFHRKRCPTTGVTCIEGDVPGGCFPSKCPMDTVVECDTCKEKFTIRWETSDIFHAS